MNACEKGEGKKNYKLGGLNCRWERDYERKGNSIECEVMSGEG